jgi:hypothetical protein
MEIKLSPEFLDTSPATGILVCGFYWLLLAIDIGTLALSGLSATSNCRNYGLSMVKHKLDFTWR